MLTKDVLFAPMDLFIQYWTCLCTNGLLLDLFVHQWTIIFALRDCCSCSKGMLILDQGTVVYSPRNCLFTKGLLFFHHGIAVFGPKVLFLDQGIVVVSAKDLFFTKVLLFVLQWTCLHQADC